MKTFKEKIKTYSFWTGLSAAVVMLCNVIAKCFGFIIDNKLVEDIIMSICGVLVALGFVCAPKTSKQEQQNSSDETIEIEQKPQEDTQTSQEDKAKQS